MIPKNGRLNENERCQQPNKKKNIPSSSYRIASCFEILSRDWAMARDRWR